MDLSNPRSLGKFAEHQLASDREINVLIDNAGIKRTVAGRDGSRIVAHTEVI
jgi:short-subunit dehydrogenase